MSTPRPAVPPVVLLDESDVFLEERSQADLQQNAVVEGHTWIEDDSAESDYTNAAPAVSVYPGKSILAKLVQVPTAPSDKATDTCTQSGSRERAAYNYATR